jgi:hypothetical protein
MTTHSHSTDTTTTPAFRPPNPDAFYATMLAAMPAGADGSLFWANRFCHYVGTDQKRTKHRQAREMRWMAQEWRARQGQPVTMPSAPPAPHRKRACDLDSEVIERKREGRERARQESFKAKEAAYIAAYRKEGTVVAAAKSLGVWEGGLRDVLRSAGVEIEKSPSRFTAIELPELPALYESGMTIPNIAERLGVSYCTITKRVAQLAQKGIITPRQKKRAV